MNILVLGSTSYLGRNIINYFNSKNCNCFGTSRNYFKTNEYKHIIYDQNFDLKNIVLENDINVIFFCLNSYFKNPTTDEIKIMEKINYETPISLIKEIEKYNLDIKFINFSSYFNFFVVPEESLDYQKTKLKFSNWINENNNNNNVKELIISDIFGVDDKRNKIFNILLENNLLEKKIEIKNPNNFVNLIYIDNLTKYIDKFLYSDQKTDLFTNKFYIKVGNLNTLIKKLILNYECYIDEYFEIEKRFKVDKLVYGDSTIMDITKVIKNSLNIVSNFKNE